MPSGPRPTCSPWALTSLPTHYIYCAVLSPVGRVHKVSFIFVSTVSLSIPQIQNTAKSHAWQSQNFTQFLTPLLIGVRNWVLSVTANLNVSVVCCEPGSHRAQCRHSSWLLCHIPLWCLYILHSFGVFWIWLVCGKERLQTLCLEVMGIILLAISDSDRLFQIPPR